MGQWVRVLSLAMMFIVACGGGESTNVDPLIDEFDIDPAEKSKIDVAAEQGDGAEAEYIYSEADDTLTIIITSSSFECGIEKGSLVAVVTELTATTMVWEFEDDGGLVTWTRVDQGTSGVVGIWQTHDPELYLVLTGDGAAQIFGAGEECEPERTRNEENCLETVAAQVAISIDGDLGDWDPVGVAASLSDELGDQVGEDTGADLKAIKVAFSGSSVYVLMQLAAAPSLNFQRADPPNAGTYRFTIKGYNGLSFQEYIYYDANSQSWTNGEYGATEVTLAAGADGIEFQIDISRFMGEGFETIDMIMIEPMDYSSSSRYDEMDCAWFSLP